MSAQWIEIAAKDALREDGYRPIDGADVAVLVQGARRHAAETVELRYRYVGLHNTHRVTLHQNELICVLRESILI